MAVDLELPESPRGKPVIVVAVEHDNCLRSNALLRQRGFKLAPGQNVALQRIAELGVPGPTDCSRDMAQLVSCCVYGYFCDSTARIKEIVGQPIGLDKHFRKTLHYHTNIANSIGKEADQFGGCCGGLTPGGGAIGGCAGGEVFDGVAGANVVGAVPFWGAAPFAAFIPLFPTSEVSFVGS